MITLMSEVEKTRAYRMNKRREDVEETRRRITEAAVELHGSVGPGETTISAVAEMAGVQRSTVYRHFADEEALFAACTSHWLASHPWPRTAEWITETDPRARLTKGLGSLYRYYDDNRSMIGNSLRDIAVMPEFVGEFMRAQLNAIHKTLLEPWPDATHRDRSLAISHAIDFRSWESLADLGMTAREAADLMTTLVGGLDRAGESAGIRNG